MNFRLIIVFIFFTIISITYSQQTHKIAVTIDDLPLQRIDSYNPSEYENIFNKLIAEIKLQKTYAIGFVNESKLYSNGKKDNRRIKLLENWLNAGLELGNHTYAHKSPHSAPVAEYEEDILKGEETIKELLRKRGKNLKYFRHPFLNTGRTLEVKNETNNFLKEHGYTIAPVTVDNSEWIFARAYDLASDSGKVEMMVKIGGEYIAYMEKRMEYWENQSKALFGRNIAHVLLIHANKLNSDYYGSLCGMIRKRNYEFASLDEALKDEAYKSEDTFIRNAGISWIHRWALTLKKGKEFFAGETACPQYIMKYAKVESE